MAEIGASLREARTRARIEIAQMEAQTKIRAKYLRAMENEEWELLPGPTYVKSFLRTYGDMLGLDGRALVAEYKRTHEQPIHGPEDLGHFSKHTGGRTASNPTPWGRYAAIASGVVVVAAGAGWFVTRGSDEPGAGIGTELGSTPAVVETSPTGRTAVTVQLTAKRAVIVCARSGSRQLLRSKNLEAGDKTAKLRGRAVLVTVSSPDVVLRVDGDRTRLPTAGTGAMSFTVTDAGVHAEPAATTACRR